ncbi:hemagglutinin/amebocyte aggregation factor [Elysia marginata]|uniref:Hemagglutinin/amebocyte aggregation factor n=1 Tax=Elysia marginata TaxID=1093978 RepID=A0AAV4JBT6_9GAST|nr:hemagglutinin/amebocyte aggregation factor [Elysia marginata]
MAQKFSVLALVAAFAVIFVNAGPRFENEYEETFSFECPQDEVINAVYSVHNNKHDDRRYQFDCRQAPSGATPGRCKWSDDYVNKWDEDIMYMCPPNMALAGVRSEFRKKSEDRRMRFKCCKDSNLLTVSCDLTTYRNDFDEELGYKVTNGRIIAGWFSVYSSKKSDRRHKFLECRYRNFD